MADRNRVPADGPERDGHRERRLPRISLAGLIFLTACVAVCAAMGFAQPAKGVVAPTARSLSYFDYWSTLIAVSTLGISVALVQQACAVRALAEYRVARGIRYALVGGLGACVVVQLLERRGFLATPDRNGLLACPIEPFFDAPWYLLLIVSASLLLPIATTSETGRQRGRVVVGIAFCAACFYVSQVVTETSMSTLLVHIATAGIEAALPKDFQRAGIFPNHVSEGFYTYRTA